MGSEIGVGSQVGKCDGAGNGCEIKKGAAVGDRLGIGEGCEVGFVDGIWVGINVGIAVGGGLGKDVGCDVGAGHREISVAVQLGCVASHVKDPQQEYGVSEGQVEQLPVRSAG